MEWSAHSYSMLGIAQFTCTNPWFLFTDESWLLERLLIAIYLCGGHFNCSRVNHKDDREWDRKHPPRLEEHSPRSSRNDSPRTHRNESPRPPRGTESPRPRERAGSTGSTSSRHSHYERDHRRGRNENSSSRNRDRERDRDRDRYYDRDRDRNRSPWESRSSRVSKTRKNWLFIMQKVVIFVVLYSFSQPLLSGI